MKTYLAAAAVAACLLRPAWAQDQNVVTLLTSLHYSGPDIESDEGPPRGWPKAGRPTGAPARVSGANGDFLYLVSGLGSTLVRAPVVPAQYTEQQDFRALLTAQARALYADDHERAAVADVRPYGSLVQRANGDLIGVATIKVNNKSSWSQGEPLPYLVINASFMYRMDFDGANLQILASTKGEDPLGPLFIGVLAAGPDGSVYAIDEKEGQNGRILALDANDQLRVLHEFEDPPAGMASVPNGLSIGTDGLLYGVLAYDRGMPGEPGTPTAGDTPTGLVYSLDPSMPGSYRVLHRMALSDGEFASSRGSANPNVSSLLDPRSYVVDGGDGWLYGTASIGNCADVSSNVTSIDTPVQYASLCGINLYLRDAEQKGLGEPPAPRYDVDYGNLYGTVFRVSKDGSGQYQLLHRFSGEDGATPRGPLALGPDGAVYGTTLAGGAHSSYDDQARREDQGKLDQAELRVGRQRTYLVSDGVLWRVDPAGGFEVVHHFSKAETGKKPLGVVAGADGKLYGATSTGGGPWTSSTGEAYLDDNYGTVWSYGIAPTSSVTLTIAPAEISQGENAELTWTSSGVRDCVASSLRGDWSGNQPESGSVTLSNMATGTYNYTLTCIDPETGSQVASPTVQLFVGAPASDTDGDDHQYGNGGALSAAALGMLGILAWRRRPRRGAVHTPHSSHS